MGNSWSKPKIADDMANSNEANLLKFVEMLAVYNAVVPMAKAEKNASERLYEL
tara:strand:+ start:112 stop:270 length:159 start_codon:yes stop_codon:yes gene_type:complete